jgi:hypothetical protein
MTLWLILLLVWVAGIAAAVLLAAAIGPRWIDWRVRRCRARGTLTR